MLKRVITGGRAKILLNGKEIAQATNVTMTLKSDISQEKIEEFGRLFREAVEQSLVFGRVTFEHTVIISDGVSWSELLPQDTSTDEYIKWMDERASMSAEDLELEAFWELAAE